MGLGNKSLKINSRKALAIALTVALAVATLGALLMLAPAKAQGTITLSSGNMNPLKVVKITVTGDLGDGPLRLVVKDEAGVLLPLIWYDGSEANYFEAHKIGPRTYVAYLGGSTAARDLDLPTSPPEFGKDRVTAFAYLNVNPDDYRGQYLAIEVVGTDIATNVLYDTVKMILTLSPKEVAYRRGEAVITLTIADDDMNLDPTSRDTPDPTAIAMNLVIFRAAGGESRFDGTLGNLVTSVIETSANSGKFIATTTINDINNLLGASVSAGDKIVITLQALAGAQGWNDKVPPDPDQRGSDYATAVYRAPTVSVSFTNQYVTIDITSPDDNVSPESVDTLDPGASVLLRVFDEYGVFTRDLQIGAGNVRETGKNTGVFRIRIPVSWGVDADLTLNAVVLRTCCEGPFYFYTRYFVTGRPEGYNIDARGMGTYEPKIASLSIVKATPKSIIASVSDADLNNRADAVEYLTASYRAAPAADIILSKGNVPVARLVLLDARGNVLGVVPGTLATELVSFVETDMNTGVFDLKINATGLLDATGQRLTPGAQYVLRYYDWTGELDYKFKDYPITIAEITISLDRTEIPVNQGGVIVYITYTNDLYNRDPTTREPVDVRARITFVDGRVFEYTVRLTETGIDTGVFRTTTGWSVPANLFRTPEIIDAKLRVYDPNYPDIWVEGAFRAHDSSVEVSPANVKWGDTITIKVKDPDANRDSNNVETIAARIFYGTQPIRSVDLVETGVSTGEFVASVRVSWDDPSFRNIIPPGTTLIVRYEDNTPITSPTARNWPTPVPYVGTFKVITTDGALRVSTAVEGYLGVMEELMLNNITVVDPDMNRYVLRADELGNAISISIEGVPQAPTYSLTETEMNSGVFILPGNVRISLPRALMDVGVLTGRETPRQLAEIIAGYVGKKVSISYIDTYSATGTRNIVTKTLALKAWTAAITTSAEAVNLGDWLTITINNPDIAGTTVTAYKQVMVKSTSYPAGLMFYIEEVSPGIFQLKLQVVSVADWVPGAKQIPAKLGDTITIEYVDPVTEDGKANVPLTKTVVVGVPVERPVPASEQKFLDVTGAEKKVGKVGETVMLSTKVQNVDVVDREFTAIFQVKDERGAVVYIAWITAKLAPGTSMTPAVSWTPTVAGTYTVEVLVVKSIAEPTPYSDKISAPFTVQ